MPKPSFEIRRYEDRDKTSVWRLHNVVLEGTGVHVGNGPWDDDVRNPRTCYIEASGEFLVGAVGNDIVAMGAFLPISDDTVEFKRMRVAPNCQRQGYATRLLMELEKRAVIQGYLRVKLDTTIHQVAAQALYERSGYSSIGRGIEGEFETIIYEKTLSGNDV